VVGPGSERLGAREGNEPAAAAAEIRPRRVGEVEPEESEARRARERDPESAPDVDPEVREAHGHADRPRVSGVHEPGDADLEKVQELPGQPHPVLDVDEQPAIPGESVETVAAKARRTVRRELNVTVEAIPQREEPAGDQGLRAGPTTDDRERIKALEREVRELRQANEILRKASAYFAQAELDRPFRK